MHVCARILTSLATLLLAGCLYATSSLIPDSAVLKPFGDGGSYRKEPGPDAILLHERERYIETGSIRWNGAGYSLPDLAKPKKVKLAELGEGWLVAEQIEGDDKPAYALAKLDGKTVRIYNSDCENFSAQEKSSLGLVEVEGDPGCKVTSMEQLSRALKQIALKKTKVTDIYTVN